MSLSVFRALNKKRGPRERKPRGRLQRGTREVQAEKNCEPYGFANSVMFQNRLPTVLP